MESRRRWGFIPRIYLPEYHPRLGRIPPPLSQRGLMFSKAERKRKGRKDREGKEREKEK